MKNALITGIIALSASVAVQAGPTLYGKANVSYQKTTAENADQWELNSNASRLGVKGDAVLNDELTAIYKAEFQVHIDDGDDGDDNVFKQRDIYAGVKGAFGQVIAGNFNTPVKVAQGKFDQFNDLSVGDIKNVLAKKGENRMKNQIMYTTPKIAGIAQLNASFIPGENAGEQGQDGFADGKSFSLVLGDKSLKSNAYFASVSLDDNVKGTDVTRFVAQTKLPTNTKLGILYQTAKDAGTNNAVATDAMGVSVAQGINKNIVVKAQYVQAEADEDNGEERTQFSLGTDYKLSKTAKVFGYYSNLKSENDGEFSGKSKESTIGTGLEVKF